MSDLRHCDGPGCTEIADTEMPQVTNLNGDLLIGWSTLSAGYQEHHFHNLGCLVAFAGAELDRRTGTSAAGRESGTSSASGGA